MNGDSNSSLLDPEALIAFATTLHMSGLHLAGKGQFDSSWMPELDETKERPR